ncbi:hypothetical protein EAH75_04570 [Rhodanobacter glycinis]|nr:hypothetical protein EAH75_04570 [Rhodanobacter glycinis]
MWSTLGWLIAWLTVIIGWVVVSDQQNHRELRKDRSTRLTDLRAEIAGVEQDAIAFHTADTCDREKALALIRRLSHLTREIALLRRCEYLNDDCGEARVLFRQACTGENFDLNDATFVKQHTESPVVGSIMAARDGLEELVIDSLTHTLTVNKSVWASVGTGYDYVRSRTVPLWRRLVGPPAYRGEESEEDT